MPRASHATTREPHYHSASERGVADLNSVEFANDVVRLALDGGDAATTWRDSGFTAAPLSTVMHRRQDDEAASRIVDFPRQLPAAAPASTLHALQEWEGFVVAVREREFVARLVDLTAGSEYEDEEATFPLGRHKRSRHPEANRGKHLPLGDRLSALSSRDEEARLRDSVSRPSSDDCDRFERWPDVGR